MVLGKITAAAINRCGVRYPEPTLDFCDCITELVVNRNQFIRPFDSTKGAEGMGIDAYQAREFIRRLGGELNVASEPHDGTTVTISISLDQAH